MLLRFYTFLKVQVTFPYYSTPIFNGAKPNHLEQRPTKWVEVVVRVMQMSHERFLEIHTFWDLSPFSIAYPANRTNLLRRPLGIVKETYTLIQSFLLHEKLYSSRP